MPFFPCAHATHPLWRHAAQQVQVQLEAQIAMQQLSPRSLPLGLLYVSQSYAEHVSDILEWLAHTLPQVQDWAGCAGHGLLAGDMDYGHGGALAVMLPCLPRSHYHLFSGLLPWQEPGFATGTALVHGDAMAVGIQATLRDLHGHMGPAAMVGGLSALSPQHAQWVWSRSPAPGSRPASIGGGGVQVGGLSGVAFARQAQCVTVGMQGAQPVGQAHAITGVDGMTVLTLDGHPALDVVLNSLEGGHALRQQPANAEAIGRPLQQALLAMTARAIDAHAFSLPPQAQVLRVVGVDVVRLGLVLEVAPAVGHYLQLCRPDAQAAHMDLRRACAELCETLTGELLPGDAGLALPMPAGRSICGAVYIRSQARHRMPRTPQVDAQLQFLRHMLGPIPLLGFTSSHEIDTAGALQHQSAQLLVFTQPLKALL